MGPFTDSSDGQLFDNSRLFSHRLFQHADNIIDCNRLLLGFLLSLHVEHPLIIVAFTAILSDSLLITLLLDVFEDTKKVG